MKNYKINKQGRLQYAKSYVASGLLSAILLMIFVLAVLYTFTNGDKNFEKYCKYHAHENNINCLLSEDY